MKTIQELGQELGLNEEQTKKLESYMSQLVMELLESIKEDNVRNFDETIKSLEVAKE